MDSRGARGRWRRPECRSLLCPRPVAVVDPASPFRNKDPLQFKWHIIPTGALHGGLLVAVPALFFARMRTRRKLLVALAAIVAGWLAGYVSWIPLHLSLWPEQGLGAALRWPNDDLWSLLLLPLQFFGLVSVLACWPLTPLSTPPSERRFGVPLALLAGIVGSAWWWATYGPWYFSLLHGAVWGLLVGTGIRLTAVLGAPERERAG